MKIAVPLAEGRLALHFGHCQAFALLDADTSTGTVTCRRDLPAPPHQPGLLPPWLAERGAEIIIAGGMGQRAQDLFAAQGIMVLTGAPRDTPEALVQSYLQGTLSLGGNACGH